MRFLFFFILSIFVATTMAQQTYTTAFDNTNIEAILQNDRLFKSYVGCLLDENPCSPDAAVFKAVLPEALATNCAKCSDRQRQMVKVSGRYMTAHKPAEWARISAKYDPRGQYTQAFNRFINS